VFSRFVVLPFLLVNKDEEDTHVIYFNALIRITKAATSSCTFSYTIRSFSMGLLFLSLIFADSVTNRIPSLVLCYTTSSSLCYCYSQLHHPL